MVKRKASSDDTPQASDAIEESETEATARAEEAIAEANKDTETQNLDDYPAEGEQASAGQSSQPVEILSVDKDLQPDEFVAPGQEVEATLKKYNEESAEQE